MTKEQWKKRLESLFANERNALVDFLLALAEFNHQRGFEAFGYIGLYNFLVHELGMSQTLAYYRKVGAELVHKYPTVADALRDGRLCVSTLPELAKVLKDENLASVLPQFFGRSARDAKRITIALAPMVAPSRRDIIVPLKNSEDIADGLLQTFEVNGSVPTPAAPEAAPPPPSVPPRTLKPRADEVVPMTPQLHRIHFTATDEVVQMLEQVKDELAREFPDGDINAIFKAGLTLLLEKAAKLRGETKKPRKPDAPLSQRAIRDEVFKRQTSRISSTLFTKTSTAAYDASMKKPP